MVIPDKVNFLQLGHYGKYSKQTYRNHFEKDFDWFELNKSLIKRHLTGNRKTIERPQKRRGHPQWHDGTIDLEHLDLSRCHEFVTDKGELYGLRAYSKALKRFVSLAIWYQNEGQTNKWQIYFSTDDTMNAKEIIEYYITRSQIEFCFRDAKHYAGLNNCQSTNFFKKNCITILMHHLRQSTLLSNLQNIENIIFNIQLQNHYTQCLHARTIYLRVWDTTEHASY